MHHVTGRDDWARVRALRYESLSNRGDIVPCAERVHADSHDLALSSSTFLLLKHGRAIGSTRASFSASRRRRDLPASATFHREMAAAIGADASVVEASLTVTDPQVTGDRRAVTLHLLKAHMMVCAVERALFMPLICVSSVMPSCSRMLLNRASMALHHLRLDHEVAQGFEVFSGRRIFLLWRVHRGG